MVEKMIKEKTIHKCSNTNSDVNILVNVAMKQEAAPF